MTVLAISNTTQLQYKDDEDMLSLAFTPGLTVSYGNFITVPLI